MMFDRDERGCSVVLMFCLMFVLAVLADAAVTGLLIWLLWNSVLISIFPTLPVIDFWQAVGVGMILNLLRSTVTVKSK